MKTWLTFNEPYVSAWIGYGIGAYAPGIDRPDTGAYEAAHNMIKAHAAVWHTYDDLFKPTQQGLHPKRGKPLSCLYAQFVSGFVSDVIAVLSSITVV